MAEDPVIFDSVAIQYGACTLVAPSSKALFWESGYYKIYYNIYHQEPCQFAAFLNGNVITDSIVGSPTGSSQNSCSVIVYVSAADILFYPTSDSPIGTAAYIEFKNHTSYVFSVTLDGQSGSGSAMPQIVATASIYKLA